MLPLKEINDQKNNSPIDQQQKENDRHADQHKKSIKNKLNGFALLLFALVIVTAAPMESMPILTYIGLAVGLVGLVSVISN